MRLLRALTLVLLMLHLVPFAAMQLARRVDGHAQHAGGEQCAHVAMHHGDASNTCGVSTTASCCEDDSTTIGTAVIVLGKERLLAHAHDGPAGPRTEALARSSAPDTPPPKA